MKITVRTPVSQRKVSIEQKEELEDAIKKAFKIEDYQLFSDQRRTMPYNIDKLEDGALV